MLLVRARPKKNESFQSYCIKLAKSNGYQFSNFCTQIRKESKRYKSTQIEDRKEIVRLITKISGYEEVADMVDLQACYKTHKSFIDYTRIKICPKCKVSDGLPLHWSLKNYLVCNEHQLQMIDKCSSCYSSITEESLINSCCRECLTPLNEMVATKVKVDHYSEVCHSAFSDFEGDTLAFKSVIDCKLRYIMEELIVIEHIYDKLCGQDREQERKKRLFSLQELQDKQLACGELSQDIRGMIIRYGKLQLLAGYNNFSGAFYSVSNMLKYPGAQNIKQVLEGMLFQPPKEFEEMAIAVNWIEKNIGIPSNKLTEFVENSYSSLVLKKTGKMSILLKDVKFVLEAYGGLTLTAQALIY